MKVELLQETEIGAGYFERVERITPGEVSPKGFASGGMCMSPQDMLAYRLREARHMGKAIEGSYACPSYGDSIILVWRYIATAQPERRANRRTIA